MKRRSESRMAKCLIHLYMGVALAAVCVGVGACAEGNRPAGATGELASPSQYDSVFSQQALAYPQFSDASDVLVLADFESADQLGRFVAHASSGSQQASSVAKSPTFRTGSPTATGVGAMGVVIGPTGATTVSYRPVSSDWRPYNLLLAAVFVAHAGGSCVATIEPTSGTPLTKTISLDAGWNKLAIDLNDLSPAARGKVVTFELSFSGVAEDAVFIDDVILLQHERVVFGDPDGPTGTFYAVQEASRYRVGASRQFELVIVGDRIVAWYDLTTDRDRMNSLAGRGGLGPMLFEVDAAGALAPMASAREAAGAVRTTIVGEGSGATCRLTCHVFAQTTPLPSQPPVRSTTFAIAHDGRVKIEVLCPVAAKKLAAEYRLNNDVGFDPIVGRVRNPLGPAPSRIGYALLRRVGGTAATSDFLAAWRPWKDAAAAVTCELVASEQEIVVRFVGEVNSGQAELEGLIRVWPGTIDTLADGERYVREFVNQASSIVGRSMPISSGETRSPSSASPGTPQPPAAAWSPAIEMKE